MPTIFKIYWGQVFKVRKIIRSNLGRLRIYEFMCIGGIKQYLVLRGSKLSLVKNGNLFTEMNKNEMR